VLLAIDVRNTHTVVGLVSGSGDHAKVVQHWRIRTESEVTADELALTLDGLIGDDSERLTGAAGLATVPSVLHELREMLGQYWPSVPHVLIEPGVRTGIPSLVDNPKEVGADRIADAVAAYDLYKGPIVVVDFGTATTFEAISARGEYLGGAIFPGIDISLDALFARAAALRRVELVEPRHVIGRSTVESMQSGVVYGYTALVDGMVSRIEAELDEKANVISPGGLSGLITPLSSTIDHHEPWLTLHGLRLIYEKNR
jgi:type III pantothenate kinase